MVTSNIFSSPRLDGSGSVRSGRRQTLRPAAVAVMIAAAAVVGSLAATNDIASAAPIPVTTPGVTSPRVTAPRAITPLVTTPLVAAPLVTNPVTTPMATNALATVVTASAREALESYDRWVATDDAAAYRSFVKFRTQTAQYAAAELGYAQDQMAEAWASAPIGHQIAVLAAMTQVGVPYRKNTSVEGFGFDCSGITTFAWARAGVSLVRQSSAQIQNATSIDRSEAKAGDLVQYPGHVMMFLGVGDAIIHSVMTGRTVELDTISARRTNTVRFGDPST